MTDEFGLLGYGAYIPRSRLQRAAIYAANAWFAPGLKGLAKGEQWSIIALVAAAALVTLGRKIDLRNQVSP